MEPRGCNRRQSLANRLPLETAKTNAGSGTASPHATTPAGARPAAFITERTLEGIRPDYDGGVGKRDRGLSRPSLAPALTAGGRSSSPHHKRARGSRVQCVFSSDNGSSFGSKTAHCVP